MKKYFLILILLLGSIFTQTSCSNKKDSYNDEGQVSSKISYSNNGLAFTLSSDQKSYALFSHGKCVDNEIIIPSQHNGLPVTYIGSYAFEHCNFLTSVIIPNSVTSIGAATFSYCSSLTSVVFEKESKLTTIGNAAFYDCKSLTSLIIPDSVTKLGGYAFRGCSSLTSINIPNSIITIGDGTFERCNSLTSLVIQNGLSRIGNYAFSYCSSLNSITIPNSVLIIGEYAFSYCSSLTSVVFEKESKLKHILYAAFYDCSSLTSIIIPESVTEIQDSVFRNCSSLTSIVISKFVTNIGNYAFDGCSSLTTIKIPGTVTSIGEYAFKDCSSLITITIPGSVTSIGDRAFEGCNSLQYNEYGNCLYLEIEGCQYSVLVKAKDTSITEVTIHNNTTFIMLSAFEGCSLLQYNEYGNCLYLGNELSPYIALVKAKEATITEVKLSNWTTIIVSNAFRNCNSLTTIVIPKRCQFVGDFAFENCSSLTIYCKSHVQPSGWSEKYNPDYRPVYWAGQWDYVNDVPTIL